MAGAMTSAGSRSTGACHARGARGEAENVHRGGGDTFHHRKQRSFTIERSGADVVDLEVIERFARAFAMVATSLAGA